MDKWDCVPIFTDLRSDEGFYLPRTADVSTLVCMPDEGAEGDLEVHSVGGEKIRKWGCAAATRHPAADQQSAKNGAA